MAGGVGSRFWPLSRASRPKQFLDITGTGSTLLQMTFQRFSGVIPVQNIFIVTNSEYCGQVKSQLPDLPAENILSEPQRRNTAPCIAYAAYRILSKDPEACLVVAPSDHLILNEENFRNVLNSGLSLVSEHQVLLTLGIKPNRPETGYGYIQADQMKVINKEGKNFHKVKTFTEKPDLKMAAVFLESGEFFWNSGIFFWGVRTIVEAFSKYLPEIAIPFEEGLKYYGTEGEVSFIEGVYSSCKSVSIDYGIMEKAENVYVLPCDFGWSDLGTWGSLYDQKEKDEQNNALIGGNIHVYDVKNTLISIPREKLVVIQGLENCIVVESEDVLLICRMDQEQRIRNFVNDVRLKEGDRFI